MCFFIIIISSSCSSFRNWLFFFLYWHNKLSSYWIRNSCNTTKNKTVYAFYHFFFDFLRCFPVKVHKKRIYFIWHIRIDIQWLSKFSRFFLREYFIKEKMHLLWKLWIFKCPLIMRSFWFDTEEIWCKEEKSEIRPSKRFWPYVIS